MTSAIEVDKSPVVIIPLRLFQRMWISREPVFVMRRTRLTSFSEVSVSVASLALLLLHLSIVRLIYNCSWRYILVLFTDVVLFETVKWTYSRTIILSGFMDGDIVVDNLLFRHALSGGDTASAAYNIGKLKFLTILEKHPELASGTALFLNKWVDPTFLIFVSERFFIS